MAYVISKDGTNYVVIDGERQENVGYDPVVSPEGSRWAYSRSTAYAGDPCYIVLDGEIIDLGHDNRVAQMALQPRWQAFCL